MACVYKIQARDRSYIGLSTRFECRLVEHEAGLKDTNDTKLLYRYARAVNLSEIAKHTVVLFDGLSLVDACITEIVLISEQDKKQSLNCTVGGEHSSLSIEEQEIVDEIICLFHGEKKCPSPGAHSRCGRSAIVGRALF